MDQDPGNLNGGMHGHRGDGIEALPVRTLTTRTGWTTAVGALLGAVLPVLLEALQAWDAPEAVRPWLPVATAVLGFVLALVRGGNSVAASTVAAAYAPVVAVKRMRDGTTRELAR